ncbi:MAG: hypothetical protein H0W02_05365 [Ktedonobacteraceae bacterium]|nr:hypothetical protein [Ktedonobacteraceae bacterium]
MLQTTSHRLQALPAHFRAGTHTRTLAAVLCMIFISSILAACGSATAAVNPAPTATATVASTPVPTSAPTQAPSPTPRPKPTQGATPMQGAPAVLDLRPMSMSIVGHLDCNKQGAYVCFARVLSRSSAQSNLHWVASTNVPGHITFSPASGVLAPGQSVLVTITVPLNACTRGLFFFRGPINTHTITWAC